MDGAEEVAEFVDERSSQFFPVRRFADEDEALPDLSETRVPRGEALLGRYRQDDVRIALVQPGIQLLGQRFQGLEAVIRIPVVVGDGEEANPECLFEIG